MSRKNYKVEVKIGEGGMGEVYRAYDTLNDRTVAIKILPEALSHNEEVKQRFLREMKVCSELKHQNVISFYDYGESDGTLFFVMEYIDGNSIAGYIEEKGQLTPEFALTVTEHLLEALHYVHSKNLIHRDLKPANVLVEGEGKELRAILMDFGLVKSFDSELTMTGKVIGTPRYIAPEMLTTGVVDNRSDIFQLGIVLYEMLAGGYAFKGSTRPEVVRNCLTATPEPVSQINPLCNVNIDNLIFNAIEKDPDCRYGSATEMLAALRACVSGQRIIRRKGQKPLPSKPMPVVNVDSEHASLKKDKKAASLKKTPQKKPVSPFAPVCKMKPVRKIKEDVHLAEEQKYGTFFGILSLMVFVLLSLYLMLSEDIVYTVRGMAIGPSLQSAEITWYSKEPYPTKIRYGRNSQGLVLQTVSAKPVTNHVVKLERLQEGSDYIFYVVFPGDKQSPEYSFKTEAFKLEKIGWKYVKGKLDITWKTSVQTKSTLVMRGGDKEKSISEIGRNVLHRIVCDPVDVMSDTSFFIRYELEDGRIGESDTTIVPSIFSFGKELQGGLSRFNRGTVFQKCLSQRKNGNVVSQILRSQPFYASLEAFLPVADVFFSNDSVPLSDRYHLYSELARCIALEAVTDGEGTVTAMFKRALGGVFNFSEVAQIGDGSSVSISLPVPEGSIISSSDRSLNFPILFRDSGNSRICELSMSMKGMTRETVIKVTINKDYILSIYNLGNTFNDDFVQYNHLFPVSLLVDGTNTLTFHTEQTGGGKSSDTVEFEEIRINFQ